MNKTLIYLIFLSALLAGCRSSKPQVPVFYLLEYPQTKEMVVNFPLIPTTIEVEEVNVVSAYSSNQIALREKSHSIRYFTQHNWAIRPDKSIERFILTFYDKNKVFKNIETRFWRIDVDYKLITTIHVLEIVQDKNQFSAHLDIEHQLVKFNSEEVVISHRQETKLPLAKRDINLFASTISMMLFDELEEFTVKAVATLTSKKE